MSRPSNPVVANGSQVNFQVIKRNVPDSYLDVSQRSLLMSPANIGGSANSSAATTLTISQVQSSAMICSPTGTLSAHTFTLPSANSLLNAFNNLNIGEVVALNVINKGTTGAIFTPPAGSGRSSNASFQSVTVNTG